MSAAPEELRDRIMVRIGRNYAEMREGMTRDEADALYEGLIRACLENPKTIPLFCRWMEPPEELML